MDRRGIALSAAAAVLTALAVVAPASVTSGASAKPRGDLIGTGVHVVSLQRGSFAGSGPTRYWSSNPSVVADVRALINALPVAHPPTVCPDDLMIPTVVAFYAAPGIAPFARVSFQLGGCPAATVYRGARAVAPALGGDRLGSVLSRITSLIVNSPTH